MPADSPDADRRALLDSPERMRAHVLSQLAAQGFELHESTLRPPDDGDKEGLRRLHASAVRHRVARARGGLQRHEGRLLGRLVEGSDLNPSAIRPRLVEVTRGSDNELLFRYAALHWSIPVSAGYGRRLRFLLLDQGHGDSLMGIISGSATRCTRWACATDGSDGIPSNVGSRCTE